MYYVKIPLRNLCKPQQLNVPEDKQHEVWRQRVKSLLEDLRGGHVPSWAVNYEDLCNIELDEEVAEAVVKHHESGALRR